MLTLRIHNDSTGTDDSANYTFVVDVNGREIDRGVVKGHRRADGWAALVRGVLAQVQEPAEPSKPAPKNRHEDCACGLPSIYCHRTIENGEPCDLYRIECTSMACGKVSPWCATLRRATNAWNRGERIRRRVAT